VKNSREFISERSLNQLIGKKKRDGALLNVRDLAGQVSSRSEHQDAAWISDPTMCYVSASSITSYNKSNIK
jgi:hypothetical protein